MKARKDDVTSKCILTVALFALGSQACCSDPEQTATSEQTGQMAANTDPLPIWYDFITSMRDQELSRGETEMLDSRIAELSADWEQPWRGTVSRIRNVHGGTGAYLLTHHREGDQPGVYEVGLVVIDPVAEIPLGPSWPSGVRWSEESPDFYPLGVVDLNQDGRDDLVYCWWDGDGNSHVKGFEQQVEGWRDVVVDRSRVLPVRLPETIDYSRIPSPGPGYAYQVYCLDRLAESGGN